MILILLKLFKAPSILITITLFHSIKSNNIKDKHSSPSILHNKINIVIIPTKLKKSDSFTLQRTKFYLAKNPSWQTKLHNIVTNYKHPIIHPKIDGSIKERPLITIKNIIKISKPSYNNNTVTKVTILDKLI